MSRRILVLSWALGLVVAACGSNDSSDTAADRPAVRISSFNFGESQVLANLYAEALRDKGIPVELKLNLGSREVVKPALESGEIDLIPEYTGTLLSFLNGSPSPDENKTYDDLVAALQDSGLTALAYAPAQDKNGFVVTKETADELGLSKVSDLAGRESDLIFGGPPECPERELCLKGLETKYGLSFKEFKALDAGGPITVTALEGGEIDVALLFTSDGSIAAKSFVLLADDKNLQPAENVVPVVRQAIIQAYGDDLAKALDPISKKLTTQALTELNRQVGIDGRDPAVVAKEWFTANRS